MGKIKNGVARIVGLHQRYCEKLGLPLTGFNVPSGSAARWKPTGHILEMTRGEVNGAYRNVVISLPYFLLSKSDLRATRQRLVSESRSSTNPSVVSDTNRVVALLSKKLVSSRWNRAPRVFRTAAKYNSACNSAPPLAGCERSQPVLSLDSELKNDGFDSSR